MALSVIIIILRFSWLFDNVSVVIWFDFLILQSLETVGEASWTCWGSSLMHGAIIAWWLVLDGARKSFVEGRLFAEVLELKVVRHLCPFGSGLVSTWTNFILCLRVHQVFETLNRSPVGVFLRKFAGLVLFLSKVRGCLDVVGSGTELIWCWKTTKIGIRKVYLLCCLTSWILGDSRVLTLCIDAFISL